MTTPFPPGPDTETWAEAFNRDRLAFLVEAQRRYGDLVHFPVGKRRHLYLVSKPEYIHYVLVAHPEQFSRGLLFKRRAGRMLGTGLLTSEGELNQRQRRLMQPAFQHSQVATYADQMVRNTLNLIAEWRPGETRNVQDDMMRLTMIIVAHSLFGTDIAEDVQHIGDAITQGIRYLDDETLSEPTEAFAYLNRVVHRLIQARRESNEPRTDLLSLLMAARDEDQHGQMTDEQLRDEVITLFIAGHETSANALTWAWYLLAQHPDAEDKLRAELDATLAGRTPTAADLPSLPYTAMVIRETLRLYSPAWNQTREVLADVQFGEYTIPKGNTIIISPYIVHRNPAYFDEPEAFRPERFTEGYEKRFVKGTYFPFSAGPRVCIGQPFALMEMQLILATLGQRFKLGYAGTHPAEIDAFIALRPRGGMPMHITSRNAQP